MRKYKYIKKLIEEPLDAEGFRYEGHTNCGIWSFSRIKDDINQRIDVRIERFWPDCMQLCVTTNAYGRTEETIGHGSFKNEIEFENIIKEFHDIIFQKGFDMLKKMSKPTTEIRPTKEMERYLYDNHESLCEEYSKILHIENSASSDAVLEAIYKFINEHRMDEFKNIKKDLIGLAAVYGHLVERVFRFKWEINEYHFCRVSNGERQFSPLNFIIADFRSPRVFLARDRFNNYMNDLRMSNPNFFSDNK